ncbi:MAG: type II toxin-antitoxin system Phd/YefM family antitoxin [Terriglobia bacterium]
MTKVGSREFKNRLGRYLRRVRQGETVVITDRGKPVARVERVERSAGRPMTLEERLRELAAQGHIRLARNRKPDRFKPVPSRGKPASQIIIDDRG